MRWPCIAHIVREAASLCALAHLSGGCPIRRKACCWPIDWEARPAGAAPEGLLIVLAAVAQAVLLQLRKLRAGLPGSGQPASKQCQRRHPDEDSTERECASFPTRQLCVVALAGVLVVSGSTSRMQDASSDGRLPGSGYRPRPRTRDGWRPRCFLTGYNDMG